MDLKFSIMGLFGVRKFGKFLEILLISAMICRFLFYESPCLVLLNK